MNIRYCFLVFLLPLVAAVGNESENEMGEYKTGESDIIPIGQQRDWPWGNKKRTKFVCPSLFGVFADIQDCSAFYVCVGGVSNRKTCNRRMQFDKYRKTCLPFIIAVCDKGDDESTTARTTTKRDRDVTTEGKFTCPSIVGNFVHPSDCSKYYSCTLYISSLKTCPASELFDGVKKECKPAKDVHCGSRQRPDDLTTEEMTTTPISTEPETTTPTEPETTPTEPETTPTEPETTPTEPETTPTEPETTPTEPETTTTPEPEITTPTTTEEPTTTKRPKVTAPDTDCDEDDVDCIIDDLGITPDWFICPDDIGSYPHPSSQKLFIFCLNWKPSVKKCGQDLVFSEDLMTCVHPE